MIQLSQLKAGYDGHAIVDISNFTLPAGEHCLLLGKSGSGKTTLLYAMAGLLTPLSGHVQIGAVDITAMPAQKRDAWRGRQMGIIFQTLHMVSALSVLENVLLPAYASGMKQDAAYAMELLFQLGLEEYAHRKPAALSQGQQQRVAIARAAICRPSIILADEPTSALDDEACESVMQLLLDLAARSGASLVVATHDARIKAHFHHSLSLGASQ